MTEAVQSFTDDALTVCPHCGGLLRKAFGSVGVVFKGTGFYRNDSRGGTSSSVGAESKSSDSPSSDSSSSDSGGSAKPASESKSEAKPKPEAKPKSDSKPAAKPASTPAASS